jgi:hypothetical protein
MAITAAAATIINTFSRFPRKLDYCPNGAV